MKITKFICVPVALLMTSCQNFDANKQSVGTGAGAVIGALIGNRISDSTEATLIGAAIGAFIGNQIGSKLDERDRLSLQNKTLEVLNKNDVNESTIWKSDHSVSTAVITPVKQSMQEKEIAFKVKPVNFDKYASTELNVRKGPGIKYPVITQLKKGEMVSVSGISENNWYQIGTDSENIGYASSKYLLDEKKLNVSADEESFLYETQESREIVIKDTVMVVCKDVLVQVKNTDGTTSTDTFQTCQGPDGMWGA